MTITDTVYSSFPLFSMRNLERMLDTSRDDLFAIANHAGRYYRPFDRRKEKGKGKWRHIDNPVDDLKNLQKRINTNILSKVPVLDNMFGGVPKRSIRDNAERHVNQPYVVTMDIRDCFPRTHDKTVFDVYRNRLGCSGRIASLLTKLTTIHHHLPHGAPTSTSLANLSLLPMYTEINEVAKAHGIRSSFFVDDITLSGPSALSAIEPTIKIIVKYGHAVRRKKTHRMPASGRQVVTGVVVNRQIAMSAEYRQTIRWEILRLANTENPLNHEIQSVRGKIEHVKRLNLEHGFQLTYLADRYLPETGTRGAKPRSDEIAPCYNNSLRQRKCRALFATHYLVRG